MDIYLYLSLIPECLIASHLPPEQFGVYYATGTQRRSRGRAVFFEVKMEKISDLFPKEKIESMCVPHPDGRPRKSKYLGIYRMLEKIPLEALGMLYLTTQDGRTLGLKPSEYEKTSKEDRFHLYQEFAPVSPRVVTKHDPLEFCQHITDAATPVSVPKIAFCELELQGLATEPENATVDDLPYPNLGHLRDCLVTLRKEPDKGVKTVVRSLPQEVLFRTVRGGFYVGDAQKMNAYKMPSMDELEREHYEWWRSAQA